MSRWTVFQADSLKAEAFNKRPLLEQQQIPRGQILARDGTKLAVNRSQGVRQSKRYYRVYPQPDLFPHAIGYSFVSAGDSGLEKSYNDVLSGTADKQLSSFIEQLGGGPKEGDDLRTTLDPKAQREAEAALGNQAGAIVALEPATGAVRAMVSVPGFDPNRVPQDLSQL